MRSAMQSVCWNFPDQVPPIAGLRYFDFTGQQASPAFPTNRHSGDGGKMTPKEMLTVFTWCVVSDAYSHYPTRNPRQP